MIFDDYLWVGLHDINWDFPDNKDNVELLDGFEPPVRQINTDSLYYDKEYLSSYRHNFNYQMIIKKL